MVEQLRSGSVAIGHVASVGPVPPSGASLKAQYCCIWRENAAIRRRVCPFGALQAMLEVLKQQFGSEGGRPRP